MESIPRSPVESQKRVLIIEDDPNIANLVGIHLKDFGFTVDIAPNGHDGLSRYREAPYALVILDLMLPDIEGLEVCKRIRATNTFTPILMLTARSEELDIVLGLELGADDYMTKPFSVRELIARIKALFRRMEAEKERSLIHQTGNLFRYGSLTIDPQKRKVVLEGQNVELTAKEYDLLELFASNPGRVYTRTELLEQVWGYHFSGYDHTVNSLINRLRNKIETDPSNPLFIKTVWGVGYRFTEIEELSAK